MRHILHIDMNSFFASCEQAANPHLKEKPLIVGGDPKKRHGIVLAASYDAKEFGVKTTMPIGKAVQLCPQAVVVQPDGNLYSRMSQRVMNIFDQYTPLKEQISIDEAFLDMTGTEGLYGDILTAAKAIQHQIYEELDLPCSVGVSSNKFLAKMASDFKKPMGITELYPDQVQEKMWHLPVGVLYGVGRSTESILQKAGIQTIGDLARRDIKQLIFLVGEKAGACFYDRVRGIDSSLVICNEFERNKSVGNENTFGEDLADWRVIQKELLVLSESVGWRIRNIGEKARTIQVKIKYSDFTVVTRSKTMIASTDMTDTIYTEAIKLLEKHWIRKKPIRLLGVCLSGFASEDLISQLSLFDEEPKNDEKKKKLDHTVDALRNKFGYNILTRASLLDVKPKSSGLK